MLGRKSYTQAEIDYARAAIDRQLTAHKKLSIAHTAGDSRLTAALAAFDTEFFNNLLLVLDRYFVHRLPGADYEGKDGNPLNEVRIICDSLLSKDRQLRGDKQIKLSPDTSVLGLAVGDTIQLSEADFTRLAAAFLTELEQRFL